MATEGWYAHIALGNVSKSAPPPSHFYKRKGVEIRGRRRKEREAHTKLSSLQCLFALISWLHNAKAMRQMIPADNSHIPNIFLLKIVLYIIEISSTVD